MTLKSQAYEVTPTEDISTVGHRNPPPSVWVGIRWPVAITLLFAVIIYAIGGIISAFAYRSRDTMMGERCYYRDDRMSSQAGIIIYGFNSNMVIVGPAFMSFGSGVLFFVLIQWIFCRPIISRK